MSHPIECTKKLSYMIIHAFVNFTIHILFLSTLHIFFEKGDFYDANSRWESIS